MNRLEQLQKVQKALRETYIPNQIQYSPLANALHELSGTNNIAFLNLLEQSLAHAHRCGIGEGIEQNETAY